MSSDEKMTTESSVSSKLKCIYVGIWEGRGRKRWINTISHDLISLNLTLVDVEDRDDWR